MNEVNCAFRFNPVGQALFYSGYIGDFTFVYDCGGKKACTKREIKRLPRQPLDLLIISHMHQDHVSGIKDLIEHSGGIRQVVLPYLEPEEFLLAAGEYLAARASNSPNDDFIRLLQDPVEFFGEGTAITRINGEEDQDLSEEVYDGEEFTWSGMATDGIRSHTQCFRNELWSFRFFHEVISSRVLAQFTSELRKSRINPRDTKIDVVGKADALKAAYRSVAPGRSLNRTSLLCLHGPREKAIKLFGFRLGFRFWPNYSHFSCATLLTGDIDFTACFDEFINHFTDEELNSVYWASVPHHGSRHNWRDELFCVLPNCYYWICNCRSLTSGHHPHKDVLRSFFFNYPIIYPCTECRSFDYCMSLCGDSV